jgi:hypothetical protein
MNNKDFNLLKEAYGEINGDSDLFRAKEIDVDINFPEGFYNNNDVDTHYNKTTVDYRIEIEYRSWGIKDIGVSIVKIHPLSFTIRKYKDDDNYDEQEVEVDPMQTEDITIDVTGDSIVRNGMVHPDSIEVELGEDLKPVKVVVVF